MSTPKPSLVKWVDSALMAKTKGKFCNIPVVELADLTWLVEGLEHVLYGNHKPCLGCDGCNKARQALAQLEAHRKEG